MSDRNDRWEAMERAELHEMAMDDLRERLAAAEARCRLMSDVVQAARDYLAGPLKGGPYGELMRVVSRLDAAETTTREKTE